jgi:hypothetical protein
VISLTNQTPLSLLKGKSGSLISFLVSSQKNSYLEMADWDLEDAIQTAKDDCDWEHEDVESSPNNSIRITVKWKDGIPMDLQAIGAGLKPQPPSVPTRPIPVDGLSAIAIKTVRPQDLYQVRPYELILERPISNYLHLIFHNW